MCAIYFADTNETERQRDTKKGAEAKRKMQEARLFCGTVTTAEKALLLHLFLSVEPEKLLVVKLVVTAVISQFHVFT